MDWYPRRQDRLYERPLIRIILGLLLLAGPAAGQGGIIAPDTYTLGSRENGRLRAWVFFSHKPRSLALADDRFSVTDAARERRQRRGTLSAEQLQELDRSVSLDFLLHIRQTGAKVRRVSRWLNAVSVEATAGQLTAIADLSFVKSIQPLRRTGLTPLPLETAPALLDKSQGAAEAQLNYGLSQGQLALINVPQVHEMGYTGKGITVLMLDTGFYQGHIAVDPARILAQYDFLFDDGNTADENAADTTNQGNQQNHGTYTYSALGGYAPGALIGPGFEVDFLLAKTESYAIEDRSEEDNYVAGLEWGEGLGAHIVSSSLGYLDWYTFDSLDGQTAVTTRAVRIATRLGMVVVTAAGNQGNDLAWGRHIIAPADADSILAVGAVDANGLLASFSGRGPTFDGRTKPDVVAQGVSVYAASAAGPTAYASVSGTSLATPLVAGSVALLLEAHPNWTPAAVWNALRFTASQANAPDNDQGWGIIDVAAAINYTPLGTDPVTGPSFDLALAPIRPNPADGRPVLIRWTLGRRSSVSIDVYNLLGQHVVNLYHRPRNLPGPGSALWQGVDGQGRSVPAGVYFVRLSAGPESRVRRLVIRR